MSFVSCLLFDPWGQILAHHKRLCVCACVNVCMWVCLFTTLQKAKQKKALRVYPRCHSCSSHSSVLSLSLSLLLSSAPSISQLSCSMSALPQVLQAHSSFCSLEWIWRSRGSSGETWWSARPLLTWKTICFHISISVFLFFAEISVQSETTWKLLNLFFNALFSAGKQRKLHHSQLLVGVDRQPADQTIKW